MKYYMEKFDEFKFYKYNLEEFIQIIQQFWYYLYAMANTFFYFLFTIFRVSNLFSVCNFDYYINQISSKFS